ncbi:hypothetical protein [uncultured Sphingomonas sp.]|uniref:hypothetical protein n=1 Tax=uncultured Sphingomonas sp. TaxID=158754 RepID=UPI0025EC6811|nr:hypothetical protein [uncultured Sphingomonas sp.]
MTAIRSLFAQRKLAVLLCAAALLLKLLIPTGYMVGQVNGHAAIILCPASGPVPDLSATGHGKTMTHGGAMAMGHGTMVHDGSGHGSGHSDEDHGRESPCAFAGLAAPGLAAADPIQLALLIAFVMGVGLAVPVLPRPAPAPYLRPPLRGPPALS